MPGVRGRGRSRSTGARWRSGSSSAAFEPMLERGVAWRSRKTYFREHELQTQTAPEPAPGELPPFLNLSQHDTERHLLEAVSRSPLIDVRWQHTLVGLRQGQDGVTITVQTPAGPT